MAETYGNIIILNGPSSAGKTTLSRNLQKIWDRPLYYLSYDSVDWYMAPFGVTGRDYGIDPVRDFLAVMYESAAAVCRSGRDVVIDNCACKGDAGLDIQGIPTKMGGTSDAIGIAIAQAMSCEIAEKMLAAGVTPPVFVSSNVDGGDEANEHLYRTYYGYWK